MTVIVLLALTTALACTAVVLRRRRARAAFLAMSPRGQALHQARRDLRALRRQNEALGRRREGNSVRDGANDDESWAQAGGFGGHL
ncbi:MAG: hypothetical protein U0Q15_09500 [Kineosporiaceae bacterium]